MENSWFGCDASGILIEFWFDLGCRPWVAKQRCTLRPNVVRVIPGFSKTHLAGPLSQPTIHPHPTHSQTHHHAMDEPPQSSPNGINLSKKSFRKSQCKQKSQHTHTHTHSHSFQKGADRAKATFKLMIRNSQTNRRWIFLFRFVVLCFEFPFCSKENRREVARGKERQNYKKTRETKIYAIRNAIQLKSSCLSQKCFVWRRPNRRYRRAAQILPKQNAMRWWWCYLFSIYKKINRMCDVPEHFYFEFIRDQNSCHSSGLMSAHIKSTNFARHCRGCFVVVVVA